MKAPLRAALGGAFALWLSLAAGPGLAFTPDEPLGDPALEDRARALHEELRCMVCQNQSIDDSDAPLARDLRRLVRKRLVAGDDDSAVIAYIHARYGDFVLLRPPVDRRTWLLWFGPALALFAALAFLLWRLRRPRSAVPPVSLSPDDAARADALLGDRGDER